MQVLSSFHGLGDTALDSLYEMFCWPLDCALVGDVSVLYTPHPCEVFELL